MMQAAIPAEQKIKELEAEIARRDRREKRIVDGMKSQRHHYQVYRNDTARRALDDALELFGDFDG